MQLPADSDTFFYFPRGAFAPFGAVQDQLNQVKKLIDEQLRGVGSTGAVIEHVRKQAVGGKMLRPGLVLLSGALFDKITDAHIQCAAVVEMIHNATLLHDDVIDEGYRRRGGPTVNSLWGNELAVVLGDFLLGRVFELCIDLEPRVGRMIAAAAVRICTGELKQLTERQNWRLSEAEYIEIITEKSACAFSCCCEAGALLSGAGEKELRQLADFGLNTGIAYQITDDLLDIIGSESKTGKTLGSDVDKNKLTLAVIHLLRTTDRAGRETVKNILRGAAEGKEGLVEMLKSCGSLDYARNRAQEYAAKAIDSLNGLKENAARQALVATARFAANRSI